MTATAAAAGAAPAAGSAPQVTKRPWALTTAIQTIAASTGAGVAGVPTVFPMIVPGIGDFELWWHGLATYQSDGVTPTTNAALFIQVTESNGRKWFDYGNQQPSPFYGIPASLYAGTGAANGLYPEAVPYVLPANRAYQISLTDFSGAAQKAQLIWKGYLLSPADTQS